MDESILYTIKRMLGLEKDYDPFDTEIISYINSALFVLYQLGIGEKEFSISDSTALWSDYISDRTDLISVQTFVKLKTQLLFDPPSNSFAIEAINKQIDELTWRLCLEAEEV